MPHNLAKSLSGFLRPGIVSEDTRSLYTHLHDLFIYFIHSFIYLLFAFFPLILIPARIAYLSPKSMLFYLDTFFCNVQPRKHYNYDYLRNLIVIYNIVTVIMQDKFEGAIDVDDRFLITLNNPV